MGKLVFLLLVLGSVFIIIISNIITSRVLVNLSKKVLLTDSIRVNQEYQLQSSYPLAFPLHRNISLQGNSPYDELSTLETRKLVYV